MSQLTPQTEGRYFTQYHLLEGDLEMQLLYLLTWSGTEWLRLEDTSVGQLVQQQMLRQGQLSRRPRAPIQTASECLRGWRPYQLSVQLVQ